MAIGAILFLVLGLSSVVRDLLDRGPHEPPLLEDDGLAWPRRYQGIAASSPAGFPPAGRWAAPQEGRQLRQF
jgi:hypothetical protein